MKKGAAAVLSLILAGALGAGGYYQFIYRSDAAGTEANVNAVYVNSVASIAGISDASGTIQRYAGIVEPQKTLDIKLGSDKKIEETYVQEGDEVQEGDKLFKYDTSDDEEKMEKDEIDVERDKNNIETSNQSITDLQKQKASASADEQLTYDTRILQEQNNIKQYEYDIKTKNLEIESCKESIANAVVTCEMDGIVKTINTSLGSSSSGSTVGDTDSSDSSSDVYMTIMAEGEYRVKGSVNEQLIGNLSVGDRMIAFSRVDSSQTWTGSITEIKRDGSTSSSDEDSSYSDSGSSTGSSTNYPFYVELDSSDGLILGQHVYLEPDQGQQDGKEGLWIDDYYVMTDDDGTNWVWAASDSDRLEKRTIELGEHDDTLGKYEILSGLDAADYITTDNVSCVEGAPVIKLDYSDSTSGEEGISDEEYYGGSYEDISYDELYGGSYEDISYDELYGGSYEDISYDELYGGSYDDVLYIDDEDLTEEYLEDSTEDGEIIYYPDESITEVTDDLSEYEVSTEVQVFEIPYN